MSNYGQESRGWQLTTLRHRTKDGITFWVNKIWALLTWITISPRLWPEDSWKTMCYVFFHAAKTEILGKLNISSTLCHSLQF